MKKPRAWRTRSNPFEQGLGMGGRAVGEDARARGEDAVRALQSRHPGRYQDGQLRTLQRHIKQWRAEHGPEREVFFPQEHRPGEAVQLDFTETASLQITLAGATFVHLLCHVVLPYSNWEYVTVCLSESFLALRKGLQAALFLLGRVPSFVQTDNSTAATHQVSKTSSKRTFNDDYLALTKHLKAPRRDTHLSSRHNIAAADVEQHSSSRRQKGHPPVQRPRPPTRPPRLHSRPSNRKPAPKPGHAHFAGRHPELWAHYRSSVFSVASEWGGAAATGQRVRWRCRNRTPTLLCDSRNRTPTLLDPRAPPPPRHHSRPRNRKPAPTPGHAHFVGRPP